MNKLLLIIKREYIARVKNKAFILMTFLSPLAGIGMVLLIAYLVTLNNNEQKKIALYDETNIIAPYLTDTENVHYYNYSDLTFETALDSVKKGSYYGLLYVPKNKDIDILEKDIVFFSNEKAIANYLSNLERRLDKILTDKKMQEADIDLSKVNALKANVSLRVENFLGKETSKTASYVTMFLGAALGYFLMMFIIIYGNMVMRSVIEEKTNRIIEIIISSVKPRQLMFGKIIGTSLAGITQFSIWLILGFLLLNIIGIVLGIHFSDSLSHTAMQNNPEFIDEVQKITLHLFQLPLIKLVICFIIFFLLGYFIYSAIYAAIGAAVDNETDTQQFMFPVIMPLMIAVYIGFFSVINTPHGTVSVIFSYIPLTSPIVMLMRIPFGVDWWEILLSIIILILSLFFFVWVAAKIYRIGILMYGKKPTYKDLIKWLKY